MEMARCMLHEAGMPPSPTKVLGEVSPYERWYDRKPSVSHFRIFGCDAVVLQKNCTGGNLKMKFVGYENL